MRLRLAGGPAPGVSGSDSESPGLAGGSDTATGSHLHCVSLMTMPDSESLASPGPVRAGPGPGRFNFQVNR
jgi:hypothetical protein